MPLSARLTGTSASSSTRCGRGNNLKGSNQNGEMLFFITSSKKTTRHAVTAACGKSGREALKPDACCRNQARRRRKVPDFTSQRSSCLCTVGEEVLGATLLNFPLYVKRTCWCRSKVTGSDRIKEERNTLFSPNMSEQSAHDCPLNPTSDSVHDTGTLTAHYCGFAVQLNTI